MKRIFTNGTILTMEDDRQVEAVYVDGNRIISKGTYDQCKEKAGGDCEIVDLKGQCMLPGFIDTHAHPMMLGMCKIWADLSYPNVKSMDQLIEALKENAKTLPPDEAICGSNFDQRQLVEKRHPTSEDLDRVSKDRYVQIMHASGHCNVVNSKLLKDIGVDENTPDPPGGALGRYPDGRPNGQLFDSANDFLSGMDGVKPQNHGPNIHMPGSRKALMRRFEVGQDYFVRAGITTVNEVQLTKQELNTYIDAREQDRLKMRLEMSFLSNYLDEVIDLGFRKTFGDEWLSIGTIKFYSDASLLSGTANVSTGYLDSDRHEGYNYHEPEELIEILVKAHRNRLHTITHATGDAAIDPIIKAIEIAQEQDPWPEAIHRVDHAGLTTEEQAVKMGKLGMVAVTQPEFLYLYGDGVVNAIGKEKGEEFMPMARFKKHCEYTISSDAPVTTPNPMNAIYAAVKRKTINGTTLCPEQRITVEDALKAYTITPARVLRRSNIAGSIAEGKLADFAILSSSPLDINLEEAEKIQEITINETWLDGRKIYSR